MARTATRPLSPYNDADYRAARRWLKANPHTRCWHDGCTEPGTTIDHVPALAEHTHIRGSRCCTLRPCCAPHNYSSGATLGNRNREPHTEHWW